MKKRSLFILVGVMAIILAMILPSFGCAPTAPPEEGAPAAPEKVWEWKPSCWASAGPHWRALCNMCDYITKASGGRLVAEPTLPGALCAVEQQIEFVSTGATPAMLLYTDYWTGKVPLYVFAANAIHVLDERWEVREYLQYYNGGRMLELLREETDRAYPGIHIVTPVMIERMYAATVCRVPIRGIEDIPGIIYRTGATADASTWESLGASTCWIPGPEIYTSLATGVVDAVSFDSAASYLEMGWDEVTDYWIRKPSFQETMGYWFCVNEDEWNDLPDDLKAVVEIAIGAAENYETYDIGKTEAEAWAEVGRRGIEVIDWSHEDILTYKKALVDTVKGMTPDEASKEAWQMLADFLVQYEPELAEMAGLV